MILSYLKEQTKKSHQEVEQSGLGKYIMNHTISYDLYITFLYQNYWAYKTIEEALILNQTLVHKNLKPFVSTAKSRALAQDLGKETKNTNHKPHPFSIHSSAEAIGALYVIEGSMLGGMLLHRNIGQCHDLNDIKTHSFFGKNPKEVLSRWQKFGAVLNDTEFTKKEMDIASLAAENTFKVFGHFNEYFKPSTETIIFN